MNIYTRRGDQGQTDLFNGQRVDKDALRVEACGTVDELNSVLGLAASGCQFDDIRDLLLQLQARLFEMGADLATPGESEPAPGKIPRISAEQASELEQHIDHTMARLPKLKSFVLPGGTDLAGRLDLARCVCRRAERICVTVDRHEPVGDAIIIYLNRLSDLLFVLARRANQLSSHDDVPWHGPRGDDKPQP